MRIADKMQTEQVKTNLQKNRSQMADLQNQAATQKKLNKPSDDPLSSARVLGNRSELQGNKQFTKSLNYAKGFLEFTDQSLGELNEILVRAKELALSQSTDGGANEETRRAVATEIEELTNQMSSIGNRKLGDRYVFGGYRTQNTPFDDKGNYAGDTGEMMIHVDKENFIAMNVPGDRVFLGEGISANGMIKSPPPQVQTIEDFEDEKMKEMSTPVKDVIIRGPASAHVEDNPDVEGGVNLFHVLHALSIALKTDDKVGVQDCLDSLDDGFQQVIAQRAQVGSRSTIIDNFLATNEKQKVDNKGMISSLEDADIYATVSDINKTQSTLQATLETSGKLITPSLLSFLR